MACLLLLCWQISVSGFGLGFGLKSIWPIAHPTLDRLRLLDPERVNAQV
jgi:hypothetical protein